MTRMAFSEEEERSRITYDLPSRIIMDVRKHGSVEIVTRGRHEKFITDFFTTERTGVFPGTIPDDGMMPLIHQAYGIIQACESSNEILRRKALIARKRFLVQSRITIRDMVCADLHAEYGASSYPYQDTEDARRMGLGDLIIEIGIMQRVAVKVGTDNLSVVYDPEYPNAETLWECSGLNLWKMTNREVLDQEMKSQIAAFMGWDGQEQPSVVPYRQHMQESSLGGAVRWPYGCKVGYPGAQMLYELGWEEDIPWKPVQIELQTSLGAKAYVDMRLAGKELTGQAFMTIQPVERTRRNEFSTPDLWKTMLEAVDREPDCPPVWIVGASVDEESRAMEIVDPGAFSNRTVISVSWPLEEWIELVQRSHTHMTANNGGLWIGVAKECGSSDGASGEEQGGRLICVDGGRFCGDDLSMWSPKAEWFDTDRNVLVV